MHVAPTSILGFDKLHWYCGAGQAAFDRSPFGAQIYRLELYAYAREDRYDAATEHRVRSDGSYAELMTVKPTPTAGGFTPHEEDLERWSMVDHALAELREVDPVLVHALCAPLSDSGARLTKPAGGSLGRRSARWTLGDMIAIYPLTQSGQQLIREALDALSAARARAKAKPKDGAAAPAEPVSALVPWEWQDPGGEWRQTTRPRTVQRVPDSARARAMPSVLQLVDEMLRPTESRLALQAAAELEAAALFGRAVEAWNATWSRLYPDEEDCKRQKGAPARGGREDHATRQRVRAGG